MQRKMIKMIVTLAAVIVLATGTVNAKQKTKNVPPSAGITDADVVNIADKLPAITEELNSYNGIDEDMGFDEIEEIIGKAEMKKVLNKHGITGPDPKKKLDMVILCYAKFKLEKELEDAPFFLRSGIRKKLEKEFNANINPDDEVVVRRHADYLDEKLCDFFGFDEED